MSLTSEVDAAAPHVSTTRGSYTVPSGRKAIVLSYNAEVSRETAATTLGRARVQELVTGTQTVVVSLFDNAVGARLGLSPSGGHVVTAGQVVSITDDDTSTAGTVTYIGEAGIVEFDA